MNIFEIIAKVGEILGEDGQNKVICQIITQGDRQISIQKTDAKITFYTSIENGYDSLQFNARDRKYVPMLIWLPTEAVDEATKK